MSESDTPPTDGKELSHEEQARHIMLKFLSVLDGMYAENESMRKEVDSNHLNQFFGYPFWMRVVYGRTIPPSLLVKTIQNFQSAGMPSSAEVTARAVNHIESILSDNVFVSFFQTFQSREKRLEWLESPELHNTGGKSFVQYCGKLNLNPHV